MSKIEKKNSLLVNNAINFYSDELDSNTGYVCLGQCVGSGGGYGIATNSIYHPI